jgi:hypothetical protein
LGLLIPRHPEKGNETVLSARFKAVGEA